MCGCNTLALQSILTPLLCTNNTELPIQGGSSPLGFISSAPGTSQAPRVDTSLLPSSCPPSYCGLGLTKRKALISPKELMGSRVAGYIS